MTDYIDKKALITALKSQAETYDQNSCSGAAVAIRCLLYSIDDKGRYDAKPESYVNELHGLAVENLRLRNELKEKKPEPRPTCEEIRQQVERDIKSIPGYGTAFKLVGEIKVEPSKKPEPEKCCKTCGHHGMSTHCITCWNFSKWGGFVQPEQDPCYVCTLPGTVRCTRTKCEEKARFDRIRDIEQRVERLEHPPRIVRPCIVDSSHPCRMGHISCNWDGRGCKYS